MSRFPDFLQDIVKSMNTSSHGLICQLGPVSCQVILTTMFIIDATVSQFANLLYLLAWKLIKGYDTKSIIACMQTNIFICLVDYGRVQAEFSVSNFFEGYHETSKIMT